ncbi:hypothetical protein GGU11DRAFT_148466 [Lentinula aff. detonsa]|uniref:SMAD/FHA domain-containing protein n=1 Tax=Lentinula aff. detonsa TaxID=2804958 RepID=A0AA38KTG5_9AGAR|nr:hypothetical protein GGU10DRAFT_350069 [Lentinula aff. detonsa]KAJ3801798.1 hypothetical protein GGU11DRAFT_148466 [Lentinula aff. detonsa]
MEDGEIRSESLQPEGRRHRSVSWLQVAHPKTRLRLVVMNSQTLPKCRVAVIDGYPEVQLGRDNPVSDQIPRIRLKEMEVSKVHASIYWDRAWDGWGVVDMGSKHGTYLRSTHLTQGVGHNLRLSSAKTASAPKRLQHLDHLTLGTTVFVVHIHVNQLACEQCSPGKGEEIPLFASRREFSSHSSSNPEWFSGSEDTRPLPKAALSHLKHQLMSKLGHSTNAVSATHYVDRSARRRAMYSASSADAPGMPTSCIHSVPQELSKVSLQLNPEPASEPAAPIAASSIGHKLLIKQGWHPGTPLGVAETGLVEPLDIKFNRGRSGLGSKI